MSDMTKPTHGMTLDRLVQVRTIVPDELAALRHLHAKALEHSAGAILTPHQLAAALDWLTGPEMFEAVLAATRQGCVFGGWIDRTLVSVAGWSLESGPATPARLRWVATDPMFAGCGAGRRLVLHTEFAANAEAQTRLAVRAFPTTSTFFEKLGYRETGRGTQAILATGVPLPVVYLTKPLRHPNVDPAVRH